MIGTGRVGLVTGVALASVGHDVAGVDAKIETVELLQRGTAPFVEPRLDEMLAEQLGAGRIRFTSSAAEAIEGAMVAVICVGRPASARGDRSMTAVESAARDVARYADDGIVVVTKSTVPPGTCERMEHTIRLERPDLRFDVASSPEFLREGHAIEDTVRPVRLVVGAESDRVFGVMRDLYGPMLTAGCPLIEVDRRTAELAKLASNAFLATKISFANALARISELSGADVDGVTSIMGADPRIGPEFLGAGLGFGGYCLPKDLLSLRQHAEGLGYGFELLDEVEKVNHDAVAAAARKIEDALWNVEGKRVALVGLAFKAGTDDVRSAPAIALARLLLESGAEVVGCDPMAATAAKNELPQMRTVSDPYEAAEGAHCLVVCTEWPRSVELDLGHLREIMAYPVLIDGGNQLDSVAVVDAGFTYLPTGRPAIGHPEGGAMTDAAHDPR